MTTLPAICTRFMADFHLHEWPEFSRTGPDGLNSRLRQQVEAIKRIAILANPETGEQPGRIVIAGDLVHKRGNLSPAVGWALRDVFTFLSENFQEVYVIPGNHDYSLKAGPSWLHSMIPFGGWDNVHIAHEPEVVAIGANLDLCLVPWMPSRDAMREAIERCVLESKAEHTILCSHLAIHGAKADNGFTYEGGLAVGDLKPLLFHAVVLGDFHHAQTLGDFPHVAYVGTPYPLTRSDADIVGGCLDVVTHPGKQLARLKWLQDPAGIRIVRTDDLKEALRELDKGNYVSFQADSRLAAQEWQTLAGPSAPAAVEFVRPTEVQKRLEVSPDSSPRQVLDAYFAALDPEAMGSPAVQMEVRDVAIEVMQNVEERDGHHWTGAGSSIVLKSVQATNFWSYANLEAPLDGQGLVLLEGINEDDADAEGNGSGKSVVVEAVYWGLFGESLRKRSVDAMVKRGETVMEVLIQALLSDGRPLEIRRGRNKGKPVFWYAVDGVAGLQQADPRAAQTELNRIMGWTPDLFRQAALFGQYSGKTFTECTDAQQKDLLEDLLQGVEKYDLLHAEAAGMLDRTDKGLQAKVVSRETAEADLRREQGLLENAEKREKEFDDLQQAKATEARQEAEKAKAVATAAQDQVTVLEQEAADLEATLKPVESMDQRREAEDALHDLKGDHRTASVDVARLETRIKELAARRDNVLGLGVKCPTCEQGIGEHHREVVREEYDKQTAEAQAELEAARKQEAELAGKVKEKTTEVVRMKADADALERDNTRVNNEISRLRQEASAQKMLARQKVQSAEEHEVRAKREQEAENTWGHARKEHADNITALKEKLYDLQRGHDDLAEMQQVLQHVVRLFGNQGLRCFLFDALAPAITDGANEALQVLSSGSIQLRLTTQRRGQSEKLVLTVDNELGSPDLDGNSGGQRRKIDLALCWAISSLVEARINVLFVDEAMDALDAVGRSRAAVLMQQRKDTRGTVINITHWPDAKGYFPKVWTARLKGGTSTLELEG